MTVERMADLFANEPVGMFFFFLQLALFLVPLIYLLTSFNFGKICERRKNIQN